MTWVPCCLNSHWKTCKRWWYRREWSLSCLRSCSITFWLIVETWTRSNLCCPFSIRFFPTMTIAAICFRLCVESWELPSLSIPKLVGFFPYSIFFTPPITRNHFLPFWNKETQQSWFIILKCAAFPPTFYFQKFPCFRAENPWMRTENSITGFVVLLSPSRFHKWSTAPLSLPSLQTIWTYFYWLWFPRLPPFQWVAVWETRHQRSICIN